MTSLWAFRRWRKAPAVTRGPIWWLWFRIRHGYPCSDEFLFRRWERRQKAECICPNPQTSVLAKCRRHGWWSNG